MYSVFYAEASKRTHTWELRVDAAADIDLSDYDSWGDRERIVINVATLYKEFAGDQSPNDAANLFGQMAALAKRQGRL